MARAHARASRRSPLSLSGTRIIPYHVHDPSVEFKTLKYITEGRDREPNAALTARSSRLLYPSYSH